MKKCKSCEEVKPFTEFHKQRNGYRPRCKACRSEAGSPERAERNKKYMQDPKNREAGAVRNREWRKRNPDYTYSYLESKYGSAEEYYRHYYQANREKILEKSREYYLANKEKLNEKRRIRRQKAKEQ